MEESETRFFVSRGDIRWVRVLALCNGIAGILLGSLVLAAGFYILYSLITGKIRAGDAGVVLFFCAIYVIPNFGCGILNTVGFCKIKSTTSRWRMLMWVATIFHLFFMTAWLGMIVFLFITDAESLATPFAITALLIVSLSAELRYLWLTRPPS
ncbi:MAG: hypothetical protein ACTHN5_16695 [Phycisphaerae bacterium]